MTRRSRLFGCLIAFVALPLLAAAVWTPAPTARALTPQPSAEYSQVQRYLNASCRQFSSDEIDELARTIVFEARGAGLAPELILAVIQVESSGDPSAVSHVGAMGLMQLRPTTAAAIAQAAGVEWHGPETLFDAVANVRMGVAYLRQLLERFGDLDTALIAYNWGPTRIARELRSGRALPVRYSERVNAAYEALI